MLSQSQKALNSERQVPEAVQAASGPEWIFKTDAKKVGSRQARSQRRMIRSLGGMFGSVKVSAASAVNAILREQCGWRENMDKRPLAEADLRRAHGRYGAAEGFRRFWTC